MIKTIIICLFLTVPVVRSQDSIPPRPVSKSAPAYPEEAERLKVGAQILLNALISERGVVAETSLLQAVFFYPGGSLTVGSKNELAKMPAAYRNASAKLLELSHSTAKKWKFAPALISGVPEEAVIIIPFTFKVPTVRLPQVPNRR